jgi:anaerobic ribonucleoside-triphosphate reductase
MYYRPKVEKIEGKAVVGREVSFERTRRITGYLVGTLERFNNAKRAEEKDRIKHPCCCGDR